MIVLMGNEKRANDKVWGGRGVLECPWCKGHYPEYTAKKQSWKFDKWVTPTRARYVCGHCKHGTQYEQ